MNVMIIAAGVAGVAMAAHAWRTAGARRVQATVAACVVGGMLAVLAWRPTREVAGHDTVTINDNATFADVEAATMRLAPRAEVTITGDGLDSASLALLARYSIGWHAPAARREIVALAWPHHATVGERVTVSGAIGGHDTTWVTLEHPDGARDSVQTDSAFRFVLVPRAAGTWKWVVTGGSRSDTIGMQVLAAPAPRLAWIEGRPNREASMLGALVAAQGGGMLQRTRLTATDVRLTKYGVAPAGSALTPDMLRRLDAVVIGPGGMSVLGAGERAALRTAVDSGLGVVHLIDTTMATSGAMPFAIRRAPGDQRARVAFDDPNTATLAVPLSPVTLEGGTVFLRSDVGMPLAWRMATGRGMVVGTRLVQPSRWRLAGDAHAAAAWWSALLGAAMRAPRAEWRVRDNALARVDHPLVVQRVGEPGDSATVIERGEAVGMMLASGTDSSMKAAMLWPRDTGWLALVQDGDTIRLWVAARDAHASLERARRRTATLAAVQRQPDAMATIAAPSWREPVPLWWAWGVLVVALGALWMSRPP